MTQIDRINQVAEIERDRYLDKVASDLLEGAQAYFIERFGIATLRQRLRRDAERLDEFTD